MKLNVKSIVEGALFVALAQILSFIKLYELPWGGSVVLAMVPLIIYAVRWGLVPGLVASFVFGVLQFMFDGGFAIGWASIIGDYLLAFTVIGFAGLVKGKKGDMYLGTLIGGVLRLLVHYVVGATIWAEYMPEEFWGMKMASPWIYSFLYNISYMLPNIIVTMVVLLILYRTPLKKYLKGIDLKH